MDLMALQIEHSQIAIKQSEDKPTAIQTQLENTLQPEHLTALKNKIERTIKDLREETDSKKFNTFLRDTEDYLPHKIWKWQDPSGTARLKTCSRVQHAESLSSSPRGKSTTSYRPFLREEKTLKCAH